MKPRICVAITARELPEAISMVEMAEKQGADLLEIRADYIHKREDLGKIMEIGRLPKILTCRPKNQGGKYVGKEEDRVNLLLDFAEKFEYVDIELTTKSLSEFVKRLKKLGVKVIISFHDFDGTSNISKMTKMVENEVKAGADICKIITTANSIEDNLKCLTLVSNIRKKADIVCFAMGALGIPSRVLSPLFGAAFTFAAITKGRESAPGQLTLGEMQKIYEVLKVTTNEISFKI